MSAAEMATFLLVGGGAGFLWVWLCVELDLPRVLELPGILAAAWFGLWLAGVA